MAKSNGSKVIRNLNSAANSAISKTAVRGIEKTARWFATDHTGIANSGNLTSFSQRANSNLSSMKLINRRMDRLISNHERFIKTGEKPSVDEIVKNWLVDHMLYILDLLWGFIWPILLNIFFGILQIVLSIVFACILMYVVYLLITS